MIVYLYHIEQMGTPRIPLWAFSVQYFCFTINPLELISQCIQVSASLNRCIILIIYLIPSKHTSSMISLFFFLQQKICLHNYCGVEISFDMFHGWMLIASKTKSLVLPVFFWKADKCFNWYDNKPLIKYNLEARNGWMIKFPVPGWFLCDGHFWILLIR